MTEARQFYAAYLAELKQAIDRLPLADAERAVDILFGAYQADRAVFLFGNGGSAALASHMAADLGKGTHQPGPAWMAPVKRLRVLSLTDNAPVITAWANDTAYEGVFARQMENFIAPGDVAFAISGSGNSPNVLCGLELARARRATTVGMGGFAGGKMKPLLDCPIVVDSDNMQRIEDAHVILSHLIFLDLKRRVQAEAQKTVITAK